MNLVAWNCRGSGGTRKRQFLKRLLRATRASVAFVSETKSSTVRFENFLQHCGLPNYTFVPSRGLSGGLWLMWEQNIRLQVITKSSSIIHAKIRAAGKPDWSLVCVYGDPSHVRSTHIWSEIKKIVRDEKIVCVVGDFNAVAGQGEKWGGNPAMDCNNKAFSEFLLEAELIDMGFKGPAYTWTNKQYTSNLIFERLDRVVATVGWNNVFPHAHVNHLPRIRSDHTPILLRTNDKPLPKPKFRIENWWFNVEDFDEQCRQNWEASEGRSWQERFDDMRRGMQKWAQQLPTPQHRIEHIQRCILAHQSQHPSMQDHRVEA